MSEWKNVGTRPTWKKSLLILQKFYWPQWESLIIENGLPHQVLEDKERSIRKAQLIVSRKRVPKVLELLHDGSSRGHLGVRKTLEKMQKRFYWINYKRDVMDWYRKCVSYATANRPPKKRMAAMKQQNVGGLSRE